MYDTPYYLLTHHKYNNINNAAILELKYYSNILQLMHSISFRLLDFKGSLC